jgi:lipopolysaccharide transport system permease protein
VTQTRLQTPPEPSAPPQQPVEKPTRADRPTFVIRPAPRWPHLDLRELWHYREVLGTIVWRDVTVRYKQTFLGVVWALLVPALTATVYVIVFGKFAKFPAGETAYPSLVVAGVIPMQYFASSVTASSMSLVSNLPLVTKVYFPRVLLPFAAVLVPIVDLLVALPVLLTLMALYGTWPDGIQVIFAPAFLLLALFTALGIGFLLSGVMYAVDQLPEKWQWILSVNPMTAVISGWRWAILGASEPNWLQTLVGVGVAAALFVIGLTFFRITEPRFADTI